ncbi:unnamed protein product, partial [Owenia fusiformis]
LKRNRITHIQDGLFEYIQSLVFIDLSENPLQVIDEKAFTYFSENPAKIYEIFIEHTKLMCDCRMKAFILWLQHRPKNIVVIHDKFCAAPRTKDELMKVRITWVECHRELFISVCVTSGIALLVMTALTGSLVKFCWNHMKYKQLVNRARRQNAERHIEGSEDDNERCDAFITYHPEKRIWVDGVMTDELIKGDIEFTLMLHVTSIDCSNTSGESNSDEISARMAQCYNFVFLVSRGWIKEGVNEFEMEAAIDLLKQSKRHTLIVIMMENIPQKDMSETLKLMVTNNFCLKWSENEREQRKFWRDLKLELGKKKIKLN